MKAARWLCARLNARVQAEDEVLTRSVQRGLASGAYTQGILSDKEVVLAGFQDWIRARMPVSQLTEAPSQRVRRAMRSSHHEKRARNIPLSGAPCASDRAQVPLVVAIA